MIISVNSEPHREEFELLLKETILELELRAKTSPDVFEKLKGVKLEKYVADIMTLRAIGTQFENSIICEGGQKFPDIIAKKYYGVEIKTTIQNHWKTTGNSVLESTRVENVERIFMLFAKLSDSIEFRCRPYEEVLSEVVVTHSPRYLIDMNLVKGETIFDKIKIPYDELRKKENPIHPIKEYYRSKLKSGEDLWWMDNDNSKSNNIVIRIWSQLSTKEKQLIRNKAMIFFPEVFGNNSRKFIRIPAWLVKQEAVVCSNIRDVFTAGGKKKLLIGQKQYGDVPQIISRLFANLKEIQQILEEAEASELSLYWNIQTTEAKKVSDWINFVDTYVKKISDSRHLDIKGMLIESMA